MHSTLYCQESATNTPQWFPSLERPCLAYSLGTAHFIGGVLHSLREAH